MDCLFIVNLSGNASPNLIKQLAQQTHMLGGIWLTSQIHFMDDQVAGLIKIQSSIDDADKIQQMFTQTNELLTRFTISNSLPHAKDTVYQIRIDSSDKLGIISDITHTLDALKAELLSFDSQRVFIADSRCINDTIFSANLEFTLPSVVEFQDVIHELEALSSNIQVISPSSQ